MGANKWSFEGAVGGRCPCAIRASRWQAIAIPPDGRQAVGLLPVSLYKGGERDAHGLRWLRCGSYGGEFDVSSYVIEEQIRNQSRILEAWATLK